jgi:hypothetical protein
VTVPAPTVRPPSRTAKDWPTSSATGLPSSTVTCAVFDELGDLLVGRIGLVERDDDVRHAYLPGEHDMLPRLRHHAVKRGDHEDRAVHLRRPGDHVLDVVGVARHVDVRVVPGRRLVLDMGDVDRDAPVGLLRCPVDHRERNVLTPGAVPPSPAGSPQRTGKGQPRRPPGSAGAAVSAARSSAQAAKTANRNTGKACATSPLARNGLKGSRMPWCTVSGWKSG